MSFALGALLVAAAALPHSAPSADIAAISAIEFCSTAAYLRKISIPMDYISYRSTGNSPPPLVERYAATSRTARLGGEVDYINIPARDGSVWVILSATGASTCNVMVSGIANLVQFDASVFGMLRADSRWTSVLLARPGASGPLTTQIFTKRLPSTAEPAFGMMLKVNAVRPDIARSEAVQFDADIVAGRLTIEAGKVDVSLVNPATPPAALAPASAVNDARHPSANGLPIGLSAADYRVPFSDVIKQAGPPGAATGAVGEGTALVTIPFAYRRTAVITQDVKGYSFTVPGVQVPAGTPGYFAGSFTQSGGYRGFLQSQPMDMWCFFPSAAGGKRENICLLRNTPKRAAIAPTRMNPYLWTRFSPMTGTFDYVDTPIFKEQPVTLPIAPELEYRFVRWKGETPLIHMFTMGKFVSESAVTRDAGGNSLIRTIAGSFAISKDPNEPKAARIAAVTAPASRTPASGIGRIGTSQISLDIEPSGQVSNCRVLETSGSAELDARTCEIARTQAKFKPELDEHGKPRAMTDYRIRFRWKIEN